MFQAIASRAQILLGWTLERRGIRSPTGRTLGLRTAKVRRRGAGATGVTPPTVQIVNPQTYTSEATYAINCPSLTNHASVSITGIALAAYQHFLVSACCFPIIFTLNATTHMIDPLNVITAVGGGDEVWHNPGDGLFYVTGLDMTSASGVQSLGVIDAETST